MSKIDLNKQSLKRLDNAIINEPIGIEKSDLPGLEGDLTLLTDNLDAESKRAGAAEAVNAEAISTEAAAARAAELELSNQIADIISNVDPSALDSLTEVVGAFQAADGDLSAAITAALGTHTSELGAEIEARISGDAATLASAKVYTDALEALHASDKAAADAAIVAAKAAADAAIVAAKATSDGEIAAAKDAADAAIVAAKATSDGEIAAAKDAADAAIVAAKVVADAATAALQVDVNQNEADADAAFAAMDLAYKAADAAAKVDSDSSIAALQAEVDANQAASDAAELELSNQIADIISNVDPSALDSLTEVVGAFQAADSDLSAAITAALGTHTSELAGEIAARISGDSATLASAKEYTDALEALHASDKAAADAAIVAAKATSDAEIAAAKVVADAEIVNLQDNLDAETKRAEDAEAEIENAIFAEEERALAAEDGLAKNLDALSKSAQNSKTELQAAIDAEAIARISGDEALDVRVNEAIFNTTPGINSMDEIITGVNRAMLENVISFAPRRTTVDPGNYDDKTGIVYLGEEYMASSFMFYMNGLLLDEELGDYTATIGEDKSLVSITLNGESKMLAAEGGIMVEYGIPTFGAQTPGNPAGNISQVESGIVDPNAEGGEPPLGDGDKIAPRA